MFTKKTRFADMLSTNSNLVLLMPRLGISLGVGDKTVQEICDLHKISADFVLLICNMYTYPGIEPDADELQNTDFTMLVPYLRASHIYYINERMPHLERHLASIANKSDKRYANAMISFFSQYKKEMSQHFAYEENEVYPRLGDLSQTPNKKPNHSGKQKTRTAIKLTNSHNGMVDKISDLLQILYKYMPSHADTEELNELIFGLLQLSSDFERHAAVEERILIPYIELQERMMQ